MSDTVIKIENLSKQYRLGLVGTGTLSHDLNRWWHLARGKEDPYLKIGESNDRTVTGNSKYVWALQDINLEVKQGEVLGIIGKNGAGKSTLLKILSRVTGPTTGSVKVRGRIGSLLEVGTGFHPELTGRENVFLNGAILGMTKWEIKSKLDEIIEFSGTSRYIDTPVKRYSSGMKVRLAFAVAAHLEPEVLVIDEVLAVGDAEFQKKAIGKMNEVSNQDGRTILFVSHNMAAVKNLCERTICLENGEISKDDNTQSTIGYYLGGVKKANVSAFNPFIIESADERVEITNLQIYPSNNKDGIISTGDDVIFELEYKNLNSWAIKDLNLAYHIVDQSENTLCTLQPGFHDVQFKDLPNTGKILCRLNRFPFQEGIYTINLWMLINKRGKISKQNLSEILVEKGDFFGTGKLPKENHNVMMCLDHYWDSIYEK